MASIKYVIELSEKEKEQLKAIVSKGTASAQTILRESILLASDRNNKKHMTVAEMAETFHCATGTVKRCVQAMRITVWRQRYDASREKHRLVSLK